MRDQREHVESNYLHKEPCPKCGSSDNLARYDDGHGHCFGCGYHEPPGESPGGSFSGAKRTVSKDLLTGEAQALSKRGISEETCAKWKYWTGRHNDRPVQIANYLTSDGTIVGQKVRYADKTFAVMGSLKEAGLYGQWLWRDGGKHVVVVEGEIDALTVSQLQGNKWPVVSLPNGAASAVKAISASLEWLLGFDHVILMFDMDTPGREACAAAARVLPPGRAKVASLPLKDANEMLLAGRGAEVIDAIWGAKVYRPDGVVMLSDIRESILKDPERGLPWCFDKLTELTYGRRPGEVYALGAGTGVGKTDFLTQQIEYDINTLGEKVATFFLEQQPSETGKRIAGKLAHRTFHIPDSGWSQDELVQAYDRMASSGKLYMYDHFGMAEWDTIRDVIRYLHHAEGVRLFYLDHLTALASGHDDERVELERIMSEIGGLVKELNIVLTLISHLATPEGKPHEEGGRVMIRHFKGSRAIGFWCHYMFGLERDQQSDSEAARKTTTFRVLKDRYTGRATGQVFYLGYNQETGLLHEMDGNPFESEFPPDTGNDAPF